MDFYQIKEREGAQKKNILEVYVDFQVRTSKDLMVRAKNFYAIWDESKQLWSTNEFDVQHLVDEALRAYEVQTPGIFEIHKKFLGNFSSNSWLQFRNYVGHMPDNSHQLDSRLTFKNSDIKKEDYVSRRLPYDLAPGEITAWDEVVGTLYDPDERAKIEWAIGSIVAGDSITIQKFLVFYGAPGTGKSTILNIIQWLFEGYWTAFVAKELTGANNSFAMESFKSNPLVAIEHDGDLSKIQDNSKLNSLVAHEPVQVNEKNKPVYVMKFNPMLMIGSNSPVKISDSKSGLIRRLIDIQPTGNLLPVRKYQALMNQVKFELGAIAWHCHEVYLSMGKDYYSGYRPTEMMLQTDMFFNFIEAHYDIFKAQNGVSLNQAWALYGEFIKDSGIDIKYGLPKYKLRDELKTYFEHFEERALVDGERVRSWYSNFNANRFKSPTGKETEQHMFALVMDDTESLFDREFSDMPAQYSKDDGTPRKFWDNSPRMHFDEKKGENVEYIPRDDQVVGTKLSDIDTNQEHYVKVPLNHIVIDFDLTDSSGKKSAERNLEEASKWPPTYAEFSKSGDGIHLHYNYIGDVSELSSQYDAGIEVKVYTGNSSLRRRLSLCNNVPIADISSGLPLKEKKLMNEKQIEDEKHLRALIHKALRKEIHPGTKSNIDFIYKVLDDAYRDKMSYNVTDLRQKILAFAMQSTNQALIAMKMVQTMKFASEDAIEAIEFGEDPATVKSQKTLDAEKEVIFDVEVFKNLFVIVWGYKDSPRESNTVMINPKAHEVEKLMSMKLVGFNCRRYDNHILYAASMGYNNLELYNHSKKIIDGKPGALFSSAYDISYTDIFDFSSVKKSLKKWELDLGIHHLELGMDWDAEVPKEMIPKVVEYCNNDVEATKVVRNHLEADFIARQILADLSGLSMNASTQQHTSRIVFGEDRQPQGKFKYTKLETMFPGYKFDMGKSTYRDEVTGEGGYVYAEPGMYENVAVLDVASMHPTSIEALDLFGEYTENFSALKAARIAIKRKDYEKAKGMLGGKLARHLNDPTQADALSYALKIVINIVYGLTSARFDNSFKDPRNIDNIVAKRGALFMIDLKHAVQQKGFQVVHIKTDSIKIPNATPEIIQFVMDFGTQYGYEFEHEDTYKKFCLVNDAVFVAKKGDGKWTATGAQFQHPYVFKYLFSREPTNFRDMCETKTVQTSMYLDYTGLDDTPMAFVNDLNSNYMKFVGKAGSFCPILPGYGGGVLVREDKDKSKGKFSAVAGTKGFFWLESEMVHTLDLEQNIDGSYFERLIDAAIDQIRKYGDFEWFVS